MPLSQLRKLNLLLYLDSFPTYHHQKQQAILQHFIIRSHKIQNSHAQESERRMMISEQLIQFRVFNNHQGEMMQSFDAFRNSLNTSLPLKITTWGFVILLTLSIVFSIIFPSIGCGFSMSCAHYFQQNPTSCLLSSKDYCCGTSGSISCGSYTSCVELPTPLDIPKCAGILITSWVLEILTIIDSVLFFWFCMKARNAAQTGDQYARMGGSQVQILQGARNSAYNSFPGRGVPIN